MQIRNYLIKYAEKEIAQLPTARNEMTVANHYSILFAGFS